MPFSYVFFSGPFTPGFLLFADGTQSVVISDDLLTTTSAPLHASVPGGNNNTLQPPQPQSKPTQSQPQSQPPQQPQPQSPQSQLQSPNTTPQTANLPLTTANKTATAGEKTVAAGEKSLTAGDKTVTMNAVKAPPVIPTTSANTAGGAYKSEPATNKPGTRAPVVEATTTGTPSVAATTTTSEDLLPMPDVIYDGESIDFDEIQTAPVKGKKLHTRTHPHRCGISIHARIYAHIIIRMHLTNPRTHLTLGEYRLRRLTEDVVVTYCSNQR